MPPRKSITIKFIWQFLTGQKKLLKQTELACLMIPPKMKNFSIKFLRSQKRDDQNFVSYFPDYYLNTTPERDYFFTVSLLGIDDHKPKRLFSCD